MYDPVHDLMVESTTETDSRQDETEPETDSTPAPEVNKPVILKHKLGENNKLTPSKKKQKLVAGPVGKSQSILSSARSRHLKKNDGEPFWRKDIQYELLKALFADDTKAFTDPYVGSIDDINMNDRAKDLIHHRLSFAELYIKTIAHSPKCSKILKDRLLNEMKMSIPTCMICLLVNVGRMNTTINFVPDMKSQLRTYHSIPSLQVNYSDNNDNKNDKQLQDTPRLKSILKACCDEEEEPNGLPSLETIQDKFPKTNIINLIFILCNAEESVNVRFFENTEYKFYDIFLNPRLNPYDRSKLFLWLLYNYLETNLTDEEIFKNPFGPTIIPLNPVEENRYDKDTEEELSFGKTLFEQRVNFLRDNDDEDVEKKISPVKSKLRMPKTEEVMTSEISSSHETPEYKESSSQPQPAPVLRQDIDVDRIFNYIKKFRFQNYKKRMRRGLLSNEHLRILKELQGPEDLTRLRLKNYKGDFGEYAAKMLDMMKALKQEYAEVTLDMADTISYSYKEDLTLNNFTL